MNLRMAVVLAAGKGKRMKSDLPKVLIPVCGRPMIEFVLDAIHAGGVEPVIVVAGHRAELVREALDSRKNIKFALQAEQLGTGHAVASCRELLADYDGPVLVVAGDAPMMRPESIARLFEDYEREPASCILGTRDAQNTDGLGRILRDSAGNFIGIVEHKDASEEQRRIAEVNMSYYVFNCRDLLATLGELNADNAQGEYYITDCPGLLVKRAKRVRALKVLQPCEALSINTPEDLANVEKVMRNG